MLIAGERRQDLEGTLSLERCSRRRTRTSPCPPEPDEMALLHFTSGTTDVPKGSVHVHEAVVAHHINAAYALDLGPDDVYWCTYVRSHGRTHR